MVIELSDTIDCLYDTYISQTGQLVEYGYSLEEAFWIHFASVSFMPWSERSQNLVPLSHILKFYAQIYRDEIAAGKNGQSKTFIKCLLKSKFDLAYALAQQSKNGKPVLYSALDIGRCALPYVSNTFKQALAGIFIISSLPLSKRIDHRLSLGRLVRDINNELYMDKSCVTSFSTVPSSNMRREVKVH